MGDPELAFDKDAYLARIRHKGNVSADTDGLEAIHRGQRYNIPFENFDIQLGRGISLEPNHLFNKLVNSERGGYCFEVNGLFLRALHAFGFDARVLLARVHVGGDAGGRTHQISLVNLNGREWIADVGFGALGLRAPIPFEVGRVSKQDGLEYRLVEKAPWGYMLQLSGDEGWQDLYSFDLEHVCRNDIEVGNHFTSTHPSAFFTFTRIAALPSPEGQSTLFNMRLTQTADGEEDVQVLPDDKSYLDTLEQRFGIVLDASYDSLKSVPQEKE